MCNCKCKTPFSVVTYATHYTKLECTALYTLLMSKYLQSYLCFISMEDVIFTWSDEDWFHLISDLIQINRVTSGICGQLFVSSLELRMLKELKLAMKTFMQGWFQLQLRRVWHRAAQPEEHVLWTQRFSISCFLGKLVVCTTTKNLTSSIFQLENHLRDDYLRDLHFLVNFMKRKWWYI